jgi:hypothetical protein
VASQASDLAKRENGITHLIAPLPVVC